MKEEKLVEWIKTKIFIKADGGIWVYRFTTWCIPSDLDTFTLPMSKIFHIQKFAVISYLPH